MTRSRQIGLLGRHPITALALCCAAAALSPGAAGARPIGSATADASLALCDRAEQLSGVEKLVILARGLRMAEDAVAADPHDAEAHFAVFCSLGKQTQLTGIGLGSLTAVKRVRRELDATLELAPDDADALAAKGALLLNLPRVLGGDAAQAECFLRRALAVDPQNGPALRYLAQVRAGRTGVWLACW